jgi:hypothetical protein
MKRLIGNPRGAHLGADLLSAYLDGHVSTDERRRIELHLGGCAACQGDLESLRGTVSLLHALPRVAVPRAFTLSEAQVGVRRSGGQPIWLGGLLRGLAAVSAVALVALTAAVLLKPVAEPAQNLARVAAPAAPAPMPAQQLAETTQVQEVAPTSPATATAAPKILAIAKSPAPAAVPPTVEKASDAERSAAKAVVPTQAPAPQVSTTAPPAPSAARAAAAPSPTVQSLARPSAAPGAAAPAAAAPATSAAAAPALSRSAPETGIATAAGKGAGAPIALTPTLALAALPTGAALVYTDEQGLWAADQSSGVRSLVAAPNVVQPTISDDRTWVAYRQAGDGATDVWGVAWTGGTPKLLLSERDLNAGLPPAIRDRRILDVRWFPGKPALAVTALAQPTTANETPNLELWRVDVASGQRRLLSNGDPRHRPVPAPNGSQVAFFRREPDKAAEGSLWLADAEGNGERVVLRFPARADQRAYAEQISWLPDSSAFWAAIPDTDLDRPERLNGLTLYRIPLQGDAQPVGRADAHEAFWSPDGQRLAYMRLAGDAAGPREIFVAEADGTNPQLQAPVQSGRFISWSPDSTRYLYEAGGQLLAGMPGQKAQPIGTSAIEAQWLGSDQVIYMTDQGGTRQLINATVDGKVSPLQALPADATFDTSRP